MPRRSKHGYSGGASDPSPRICHVHSSLFVTGINELKALLRHNVHQMQGVVTRQGKDLVYPFRPQCLDDKV